MHSCHISQCEIKSQDKFTYTVCAAQQDQQGTSTDQDQGPDWHCSTQNNSLHIQYVQHIRISRAPAQIRIRAQIGTAIYKNNSLHIQYVQHTRISRSPTQIRIRAKIGTAIYRNNSLHIQYVQHNRISRAPAQTKMRTQIGTTDRNNR